MLQTGLVPGGEDFGKKLGFGADCRQFFSEVCDPLNDISLFKRLSSLVGFQIALSGDCFLSDMPK